MAQIRVENGFVGYNYASRGGGGIYAYGALSFKYSTLDHNRAGGDGGGALIYNGAALSNATVSANESLGTGGGIVLHYGTHTLYSPLIYSTTVSENVASSVGGLDIPQARIAYSTIAFNSENGSSGQGAGLRIENTAYIENTIIANNRDVGGASLDDIGGSTTATISGHHNLIGYATMTLPADTIIGQDPLLAPLAWNGGTTKTHALMDGSPAIDAGGGAHYPFNFDQRGVGFARVIGSSADIGAYERNALAEIFISGFDP